MAAGINAVIATVCTLCSEQKCKHCIDAHVLEQETKPYFNFFISFLCMGIH